MKKENRFYLEESLIDTHRHIPFREVFANQKLRFFLCIVVLLWIAVGTQALAKQVFNKEGDIMSAFLATNSGLMESTLEMTADYGDKYLSQADKETLIKYIANGMGILVDSKMDIYDNGQRQEISFVKKAARAQTTIKIVTVGSLETSDAFAQTEKTNGEVAQYLMVRLVIYEDANNDILSYKDMVETIYHKLNVAEKKTNTTLQLCGAYSGNLMLDTKNKMADSMIKALDGTVIFENREEDLYTIYAYTGLLREYIVVDENKINIQVAITYDEDNDCTRIYLATPIISGDW